MGGFCFPNLTLSQVYLWRCGMVSMSVGEDRVVQYQGRIHPCCNSVDLSQFTPELKVALHAPGD